MKAQQGQINTNIIGSVILVETMFISPSEPKMIVNTLNIAFHIRIHSPPLQIHIRSNDKYLVP